MSDIEEKWKKRLERERAAKKEAEKLLEDKSLELFNLNKSLQQKVDDEIKKSKEREAFLAEQSKLASMGEMIGNIAHQWRQPLSAITSLTSSTKLQMELEITNESEINEVLSRIETKAKFLSNTIDDFRNFFKSDNKKVEFDIVDVIKNVQNIILAVYQNNNITIVKNIDEKELLYKGLPGELTQVLLNIFNNAKDILVEKDIKDKIVKIDLIQTDKYIKIDIYDNANGIPKDIESKIFEPYFTTKHQSQGTGIGLYMCREIIKNHFKGLIYAKNKSFEANGEKQFGACFTIEIEK